MTQSKHTKRALLASILSVVLCCAMFIGSTFAWFTDSVTSGKNQIVAGNLKVDLIHVGGGEEGADVSVKENSDHLIFDYDKWEPNYTVMETLKVVNNGNLALKFRLDAVAAGATAGPNGEKLADVIDVYVYEGTGNPADTTSFAEMTVENGWRNAGSLSKLMADPDGIARGVLLPAGATPKNDEPVGSVQMTVALHMQESAGNGYQGLSLGNLSFTLNAAQYTYEDDSFGSNYDADAKYDRHFVTNETELNTALSEAAENDVIQLSKDVVLSSELNLNKAVTLDLGGKVLEGRLKTTAPADTGKVVVKNGTLKSTGTGTAVSVFADSGFAQEQIFENLIIEAPSIKSNTYAFRIFSAAEGSRITVSNCTITSAGGGLSLQASAEYVFDKLTVKAGDNRALYAGSGSGVYTLSGLNLSNNSATYATVDLTGTMLLENCRVENAAENGKAIKLVKMGVNNTISGDNTSITGKLDISSNVSLQISGGIFSEAPADKHIAKGMQVYQQDDGTFMVSVGIGEGDTSDPF